MNWGRGLAYVPTSHYPEPTTTTEENAMTTTTKLAPVTIATFPAGHFADAFLASQAYLENRTATKVWANVVPVDDGYHLVLDLGDDQFAQYLIRRAHTHSQLRDATQDPLEVLRQDAAFSVLRETLGAYLGLSLDQALGIVADLGPTL